MIPYSYNMVDMGGIDLAEANGTVVPGVYERITEAMNLCGDVILYHWKFAGIDIVPSAYAILQQSSSILINGMIQVTELDEITILAIEPPIVPVEPLEVTENGVYEADPPSVGFNPVTVIVPERQPVIEPISITENGTYTAPTGKDGFSPVTVNVPSDTPVINPISITENGTYNPPTGVDGYAPISVNVPSDTAVINPISITENGTYNPPIGVDGYAPISVNVPSDTPVINPISITENGTYNPPTGVDGYAPISVNVPDSPLVIYSNDRTLAVYIDKNNNRLVWYFMGFAKQSTDVPIPSEIYISQPGLMYSKAYGSDKETQIGQIGFYNGSIRSWNISTTQTLAGTFWGVVYSDGGVGQTNPYSDPPNE